MKRKRAREQKGLNRKNYLQECHDNCVQYLINHHKLNHGEMILIENGKKISVTKIKEKVE